MAAENSRYSVDGNGIQVGVTDERAEAFMSLSKKLQDDVQEAGEKIKHYDENVKYLKSLVVKLDDSISEMKAKMGNYERAANFKRKSDDPAQVPKMEDICQCILQSKHSAAALLCRIKTNAEAKSCGHSLVKDVLGVVAILGKVNDANLSRIFAEYLGPETMLAIVCKTLEGVKAIESYTTDRLIDKSSGIHGLASSVGIAIDGRFDVICLENLRPCTVEKVSNDPQLRLELLQPRLANGEKPPGFLGFAVNMITIESTDLYSIHGAGHSLRDTLFYHLFSDLQVYRSREDMLKALPYIRKAAISLDGGIIRSPGVFALGPRRENVDICFPLSSGPSYPIDYFELQNQLKRIEWKKTRTLEDIPKEQELLDHARFKFEAKKNEFIQFIASSSSHATQYQMQPGSGVR